MSLFWTMRAFNLTIANTSLWLSGSAYCGKDKYPTMVVGGPAKNFDVVNIVYDKTTDLQGYTGITRDRTIYVVFRGSSSKLNWKDDFEIRKIKYTTYPECDCEVHHGFYEATTNIKEQVIQSVKNLKNKYINANIVVTGHSLGAAIAQLIGMELYAVNITNSIYNFGQPRVGDEKYANFVNTIITDNIVRFTHNKDMVPHLPPEELGYLHSCTEIFEDEFGNLHECSSTNCEDSMCADQYSLLKTNTDDHSIYLEHYVNCGNSTIIQ
jgi:hypothetical protein